MTVAYSSTYSGLVVSSQQSGSYTAVLSDANTMVEMTSASANTFTIPPNSSVAFPIGTVINVCQIGAGATTLAAGGGVTLDNPGSTLQLRTQYSVVTLRKRATDEWVISGDVT